MAWLNDYTSGPSKIDPQSFRQGGFTVMISSWGDDLPLFGDACFTLEPQAINPFWTLVMSAEPVER